MIVVGWVVKVNNLIFKKGNRRVAFFVDKTNESHLIRLTVGALIHL